MKKNNYKRGAATVVVTVLFLIIVVFVVVGTTTSVSKAVEAVRVSRESIESLSVVDSSQEDAIYRIKRGLPYDSEEVVELGGAYATSTITDDLETGEKFVSTIGDKNKSFRKRNTGLIKGDDISFNYGVQVGQGGLLLKNGSSVNGNVYSSGNVNASSSNYIRGSVISAGPTGLVMGVYGTSSVYAHNIKDSTVEGDAFYTTISNSSVWGTLYPNSTDQPLRDLPITDATIEEWKDTAEAGGVSTSCTITTTITIGPKKYDCDLLNIRSSANVTLAGMVWVDGNLEVENNAIVRIDEELGSRSLAIIADKESNRLDAGTVLLQNNAVFYGTGEIESQVLIVSGNTSEENGGSVLGIDLENNNAGDLSLYCNHCRIRIQNNAVLTSVTGYLVEMINNAVLNYRQGIASSIFDTGPGGSWDISGTSEVE